MPTSPQLDSEMLTPEDAAAIRLGRDAAYALASRWRDSGGEEDIPCVELGRTIHVHRQALLEPALVARTAK